MALIPCPACENQVSSSARNCPKCGHPIATAPAPIPVASQQTPRSRGVAWLFVVMLTVLIGAGVVVWLTQNDFAKKVIGGGNAGNGPAGLDSNAGAHPGSGPSGPPGIGPIGGGSPVVPITPVERTKPAPVKKDIVGRWDVVRSGQKTGADVAGYMRFNRDGTFTSTLAFLMTSDGKYKVMSISAVELDFPGVLYGRNKMEFNYTLTDDRLTLAVPSASIDLEFRRTDSGE